MSSQRRRQLVARVGWLIAATGCLALAIAMLPAAHAAFQVVCARDGCQLTPQQAHALAQRGISVFAYAVFNVAVDVLFLLASCVLAAIIFWRAPKCSG